MSEIKTFEFNPSGVEAMRAYKYGSDWPVVYIIENGKDLYVGETIRAYARTKQHLDNPKRKKLKNIHIITDDEFNKSATLDTESSLIEYLVADGQYTLQNGNGGLQDHEYFDREKYQSKFEVVWKKLQDKGLAKNDLLQIRNSDLFKYSPYKTLTDDQYLIATELLNRISSDTKQTYVVHGGPGTGKTILATYLMKRLAQKGQTNIGLVIAMTSLRKTLKNVFRGIPDLKPSMVIGPGDVIKKKYDVLIVDETHRLRQRRNIPNFQSFDATNRHLGLDKDADELEWVIRSAKQVILFYDEKQSVRPSDIAGTRIKTTKPIEYSLKTQVRVKGGDNYITYVDELLEGRGPQEPSLGNYDFKVYDDLNLMVKDIKDLNEHHKLCRILAGYAWKWVSRDDRNKPDIVIGDTKLFWNSQTTDWVNSPNSINEVGCIHTIQGYDLNYAGVIIGPELSYDHKSKQLRVIKSEYKDTNGHRGITDPEELKRYIINIYKTLMTRGILGTYIYVCDENLRKYFKREEFLSTDDNVQTIRTSVESNGEKIISPYNNEFVEIPLYDSIGCGESMHAETLSDENIKVPAWLIKPGAKYFALHTRGDSMNQLGINDGDIILCQKNYQASDGSNAIVLIGDDATLKKIKYERDGLVLIPKSDNPIHQIRKLTEDDEFKVLGVFVCKIEQGDIQRS